METPTDQMTVDQMVAQNLKRETNTQGLDAIQIERRRADTKRLQELYPKLSPMMLDILWNWWEGTPKDEVQKIIDEKTWEKPPTNPHTAGGVIKCITIEENNNV